MNAAENAESALHRPLGETLAAERERQGLGRGDVAQRLHMSASQVEALEKGDYTRLPRGTFLRGFVRNYAKVLGLAPDTLLPLLQEAAPAEKAPGIVVPTQNIRFDPIGDRLSHPYVKALGIAAAVLALGFFAMYWWLFIRPTPPGSAKKSPADAATVANAPAPVPSAPATPPEAAVKAQPNAEPAPTPPVAATRVEPPQPQPSATEPPKAEKTVVGTGEGSVLKFRFKGPSWVEIRDARGRVLLAKLNPPGSEAEVSGRPPFNVIVGNAPEVQLFYNDHEFDLEPHTKVAVARFTVE